MKPPSDGRVGWRFYRLPWLAKLGLAWSLRIYSELHETTATWQSKLAILQDWASPGACVFTWSFMKPPLDGRVGWHIYRIPRLEGLGLVWSFHLYSELHETTAVFYMNLYHEITTRCSRVVVRLARIVLNWGIRLYSEIHHEITTRCSRVGWGFYRVQLARIVLNWSISLYSELHYEITTNI
jgi:hypothetical protein